MHGYSVPLRKQTGHSRGEDGETGAHAIRAARFHWIVPCLVEREIAGEITDA